MNAMVKSFFKVCMSNFATLTLSIFLAFILPKYMSLFEFSMWQLYIFYLTYAGFLHCGWVDGVYLRYAGCKIEEIDSIHGVTTQYILFFAMLSAIISLVCAYLFYINYDIVIIYSLFAGIFFMSAGTIRNILQITNRLDEYVKIIFFECMCTIISIFICIHWGFLEKNIFIGVNVIIKIATLIFCLKIVYPYVNVDEFQFYSASKEILKNIAVGHNLMLSNCLGLLVVGLIRLAILENWNIIIFGKVALALSLSNFILSFVNSASIVLFPILKQNNDIHIISTMFERIRIYIVTICLGMLLLYYPLTLFINVWLPTYREVATYLAILFPICFYETRTSLLANTYLKSLREEKFLLKVNIYTVIVSAMMTIISVYWLKNLNTALLGIVISLAFRCFMSELHITTLLHRRKLIKENIIESIIISIFILLNLNGASNIFFSGYIFFFVIYLIKARKRLSLIDNFKL